MDAVRFAAVLRKGFTLIELLVVLGIVAVMFGLLLSAVQRVRGASARAQCSNNLRQIGLAIHGYHDVHRVLPPGIRRSPDPYPFLGWCARLLPHLEQQAVWEQAQRDYAQQPNFWGPPVRHADGAKVLPVFVCPADGRSLGRVEPEGFDVAFTHYLGVMGTAAKDDGVLYLDSRVSFRDITDGMSNTLMVGERPPSPDSRFGWWYAGIGQNWDGSADMLLGVQDYRTTFRTPTCPWGPYAFGPGRSSDMCDIFHFWSQHPGGGQFLLVDGSARFVSYAASLVLPALATRNGGEAVEVPD